jgi:zinc protease
MSSRLFSIVREKYGLTYGINSAFLPLQDRGPFMINLLTRTASSEQALTLTRQITADFINKGVTAQELQTAKQSLIGSFPLRIMTNSSIVNYLTVIGFYHLPLDYLNTFTSRVNAVTLDQVNSALKQRLNPALFVTITVGSTTKQPA